MSSSFSAPLPLAHADSHSEAICQVLSPHPSYKLLLLSTTVLLHNSSGIPLEICFLDGDLNPLLLPAAHGAYASLGAIGESSGAQKGGRLSVEGPSSLHPDLSTIPRWMLEREQRWKEEQQRETLQQREQLRLLLQDATTKPAAPKRAVASPLRRAATDASRIAAFNRSTTGKVTSSAAFLQQQESSQECLLRPPTQRQMLDRLTYTFLLPNQHVLSVPQRAILDAGWCNICFRPAAFAEGASQPPALSTASEAAESKRAPSDAEVMNAAAA